MVISGTAYSVALNDRAALDRLGRAAFPAPYNAPPQAPVIAIKPRNCWRNHGASIPLPEDLSEVEVAPTLALLFAADCGPGASGCASIGAACLALDVAEPGADFYRPAIRQRCRDGFLPLGDFGPWTEGLERAQLATNVDGRNAHQWSLDRLVRPVNTLIGDLAAFMTLRAGDLLLVGLPDDAPRVRAGQSIEVRAMELPALRAVVEPAA